MLKGNGTTIFNETVITIEGHIGNGYRIMISDTTKYKTVIYLYIRIHSGKHINILYGGMLEAFRISTNIKNDGIP